MKPNILTRRELLAAAGGALAASMWTSSLAALWPAPQENTVKDRLWLFGSPTDSTAPHTKRRTVMSPAEGAFYLGIPNIYMNQANAGPESQLGRFEPPFAQYAVAPRLFKRGLWGLVGSGGFTTPEERKEGMELICKTPNFVGAHLDDFLFLSNGVMDVGFESVDWTREWIQKVGDTRI